MVASKMNEFNTSIKNILYKSDSVDEAEAAITEFWKNNARDVGYIMNGYYSILGAEVPDDLKKFVDGIEHYNNNISYGLV